LGINRESESIDANKKSFQKSSVFSMHRIGLSTLLLFSGMTVAFFTRWLGQSIELRGEMVGLATFRYNLIAYLLILFGACIAFLESNGGVILKQRFYRIWLFLYFSLFTIMVVKSYFTGAGIISVLWNSITYLLVIVMFFSQRDNFWLRLNRILVLFTILGVLYSAYIFVNIQLPHNMTFFQRNIAIESDLGLFNSLLFAAPFLLFTFPIQSKGVQIISVLGCLFIIMNGILTLTRSTVLQGILSFLLAYFICSRVKGGRNTARLFIKISVLLIFLVFLVWASGWVSRIGIIYSWEALVNRATSGGSVVEKTLEDYRFTETKLVANQMSWDEWLLGRGVSGTWSSPMAYFGSIRNMIHIGYMNLVFKGGIFFLLLFIIFPLGAGWWALFNSSNIWTLAAAAMMVRYSVNLLYGGCLGPSVGLVLLYLCAGRLAANKICRYQ